MPVLEAVLRLERLGQIATPETIAAEAILHLDDVKDGIRALADAGYVELLEVISDDGARTTVVSPAAALRSRSAPKHEWPATVEAPRFAT